MLFVYLIKLYFHGSTNFHYCLHLSPSSSSLCDGIQRVLEGILHTQQRSATQWPAPAERTGKLLCEFCHFIALLNGLSPVINDLFLNCGRSVELAVDIFMRNEGIRLQDTVQTFIHQPARQSKGDLSSSNVPFPTHAKVLRFRDDWYIIHAPI